MVAIAEKFGRVLVVIGAIGFITASILSFTDYSGLDEGAVPAASFFLILVGMIFNFPTLLQEASGGVSTMRVAVLAIVIVFSVVHLKIGWNAGSFKDFEIDRTWVYIIGLAFGSKVFQKFGETADSSGESKKAGGADDSKTN